MKKKLFETMVGRKSLLLLLVFLTFSVAICGSRGSTAKPMISVNPREPTSDGKLTVDIVINDATDLGGYEFKLKYNSNVLTPTDVTIVDDPEFFYDHHIFHEGVYGPEGCIWLVVTLPLGTIKSVNGSGTITTIEFIVDAPGETALELYDTILGTLEAEVIEHTSVDAHVHLLNTWQGEYVPMSPSRVFSVEIDGVNFDVLTYSNSSVTEFDFSRSWNKMEFVVEGTTDTSGYLDVVIPKDLLKGSLSVSVDGTPIDFTMTENATHYFLSLEYSHSTHTVGIMGSANQTAYSILILVTIVAFITLLGSIALALSKTNARTQRDGGLVNCVHVDEGT